MRVPINLIRTVTRARIRSLMILVALCSLAIWSAKRVTEFYRFRTIKTQRLSKAAEAGMFRKIMEKAPMPSSDPTLAQWASNTIRYHSDLEEKYRKGAAEPDVDLKPDPPEPPFPLEELVREHQVLKKRLDKVLRGFGNGSTEEKPDPPQSSSPIDVDQVYREVHALKKKRDEIMREVEESRRRRQERRRDAKPGDDPI